MSELDAQNSDQDNDNYNINKFPTLNKNIPENLRKRKINMESEQQNKILKNNYWAILDNDKNCDQECLKLFEKHVNEVNEKPTTSAQAATENRNKENKNKDNNNQETRTNNNNNTPYKNNTNKNTKVPPINIYDVEPNKLITFIKDGLKITEFKIRETYNKKISLFMSSLDDYFRVKAYLEKINAKFFTFTPKDI